MNICLDIETTGLDFENDRIITVALALDSGHVLSLDKPENEAELLEKLEDQLAKFFIHIKQPHVVVTWNGSEFDLPFLAARYAKHGIPTSLSITKTDQDGKYGRPRFDATWGPAMAVDLAYVEAFKLASQELGVKHSLKPLAEKLLGIPPMEGIVFGEDGALGLDPDVRSEYCRRDAELVLALDITLQQAYILSQHLRSRNN